MDVDNIWTPRIQLLNLDELQNYGIEKLQAAKIESRVKIYTKRCQ